MYLTEKPLETEQVTPERPSHSCNCTVCVCRHLYVHRSVHTSRASAPTKNWFYLPSSIAFIKSRTKETVGNMPRKEMCLIGMDKGKPASSVLLRLCLLYWLPQQKSSLSFGSLKTLHIDQNSLPSMLSLLLLLPTVTLIYTKKLFNKSLSYPSPLDLALSPHIYPLSSQNTHWSNAAPLRFPCGALCESERVW